MIDEQQVQTKTKIALVIFASRLYSMITKIALVIFASRLYTYDYHDSQLKMTLIYRPLKKEFLSWPK